MGKMPRALKEYWERKRKKKPEGRRKKKTQPRKANGEFRKR